MVYLCSAYPDANPSLLAEEVAAISQGTRSRTFSPLKMFAQNKSIVPTSCPSTMLQE